MIFTLIILFKYTINSILIFYNYIKILQLKSMLIDFYSFCRFGTNILKILL